MHPLIAKLAAALERDATLFTRATFAAAGVACLADLRRERPEDVAEVTALLARVPGDDAGARLLALAERATACGSLDAIPPDLPDIARAERVCDALRWRAIAAAARRLAATARPAGAVS